MRKLAVLITTAFFAVALPLMVVFTLASCGSKSAEVASIPTPPPSNVKATPPVCESGLGAYTVSPALPAGQFETIMPRGDRFCGLILVLSDAAIQKIQNGVKTIEHRISFPADNVSHIVFYNGGTDTIVGIAETTRSVAGLPVPLIEQTWQLSGSTQKSLLQMFHGRLVAFATEFRNFRPLVHPITRKEAQKLDPTFKRPRDATYIFIDRFPEIAKAVETDAVASGALSVAP